jgi:hypothetical protein
MHLLHLIMMLDGCMHGAWRCNFGTYNKPHNTLSSARCAYPCLPSVNLCMLLAYGLTTSAEHTQTSPPVKPMPQHACILSATTEYSCHQAAAHCGSSIQSPHASTSPVHQNAPCFCPHATKQQVRPHRATQHQCWLLGLLCIQRNIQRPICLIRALQQTMPTRRSKQPVTFGIQDG